MGSRNNNAKKQANHQFFMILAGVIILGFGISSGAAASEI